MLWEWRFKGLNEKEVQLGHQYMSEDERVKNATLLKTHSDYSSRLTWKPSKLTPLLIQITQFQH